MELKTIETEFKEVLKMIGESFDLNYASKNPDLVRFLMEKVQQEKDRNLAKIINGIGK